MAAGPLIGAGRATTWAVLVIAGSLVASVLALSLRRRLTPAQDGRESSSAVPAPAAPPPPAGPASAITGPVPADRI